MFIVLFFSPDFIVFEIGEKYTPISAFSKPHPSLKVMFRGGVTAGRTVVWCGLSVPRVAGKHWGWLLWQTASIFLHCSAGLCRPILGPPEETSERRSQGACCPGAQVMVGRRYPCRHTNKQSAFREWAVLGSRTVQAVQRGVAPRTHTVPGGVALSQEAQGEAVETVPVATLKRVK